MTRAAAGLALGAALSVRAAAQCPDGGPPPCRAAAAPARAVTVDPNRVAVLPFRVTTADSLLGEGFAELLAPEFTGEGGPRSVDMATMLAAWRRAGGGLRTPLSQESAGRLARGLGAGKFVQGSVVGVGARLRVQAAVLDASSGAVIGAPASASSTADSLEFLVGQVATTLLGSGAQARARDAARLTQSPAAMRAYIEGLALLRRGRFDEAAQAFVASIAADSTFASPVYQRWLIASQLVQGGNWAQRVTQVRDRLTPRERAIIEAQLAPGRTRSAAQGRDERRRTAELLGDSPEMWFLLGDQLFHGSRLLIPSDSTLTLAGYAFARSTALDSQPLLMYHPMHIALVKRDSAAMRALASAYGGTDAEWAWPYQWVVSNAMRDAAAVARLRRSSPKKTTATGSVALAEGLDSPAPATALDEGFAMMDAAAPPEARDTIALLRWLVQVGRGRPAAAEQSVAGRTPTFWRAPFAIWAWVSGDLEQDAAVMRLHGAAVPADSAAEARRRCFAARLHAARGQFDSVDTEAMRRLGQTRCARIFDTWRAFANRTLTDSAIAVLDTIVASSNLASFSGYEHRLLASIYEARGDTARALWALRLYPRDHTGTWTAPTYREEGRLFLMNRDTTRAVESYRRYLELRSEAEPPHVAERDSIRALVARLSARR